MSNPFESIGGANAPRRLARENPFDDHGRGGAPGHDRTVSAASSHEEFSNPFERASGGGYDDEPGVGGYGDGEPRDGGGGGGGGYGGEDLPDVPLPTVPMPGAGMPGRNAAAVPDERAVAYEPPADVNSTFGAYDVASGAQGHPGVNSAPQPAATTSSFRSSATAMFKSAFGGGSSATAGGVSQSSLAAQQRDLERREADVTRRERDLEVRERELRGAGGGSRVNSQGQVLNWPFKRYAILYHNIAEEVMPQHRTCVKMCYAVYCIFVFALIANFLVCTFRLFVEGNFSAFLMSFIYLSCGIPGAWSLWYRRLYNACKSDRAFGFLWFFAMFMVHTGFVSFASLAPSWFGAERWSFCGVLNLKQALEKDKILGVMHAVVMSLFMLDALLSVVCMRWVYKSFRGGGHTIEQARAEAYREGLRSATMGGVGSSAV